MKYRFYLLIVLINFSCKNVRNSTHIVVNVDSIIYEEISDTIIDELNMSKIECLDTLVLKDNRIRFQKHRARHKDRWKWIVIVDDLFSVRELDNANYFYSSSQFDKNCNKTIDYFELDSIQLFTKSKTQTIYFNGGVGSSIEDLRKERIEFVDINFDGYKDISIYLNLSSGAQNVMYRYFIYKPSINEFSKGLDMVNLQIHPKSKELTQYWTGGHAGKIGGKIWFELNGLDSLRVVKILHKEFNDTLKAHINTYRELVNNELMITKIDTLKI